MATIRQFNFVPTILSTTSISRSVVDLLPSVNQTNTIKNFFTASADHLFSKGDAEIIDGYIGSKPNWNNDTTDHYIPEPDAKRQFYQLSPVMVSKDNSNNTYTNVLFYEDLINQLDYQGAITNNHTRLFENGYYTWCPPIDLDKFINFRKYVWVGSAYPDYFTISPNSSDKNPWSSVNSWKHETELTPSQITNGKRATRQIVEFLANMELYNYGRFRRDDVDYVLDKLQIKDFLEGTSVVVDGVTISVEDSKYFRVLVLDDVDGNYTSKICGIYVEDGKFLVTTESDGQDSYGAPVLGEITKVTSGNSADKEFWYNGETWVQAQAKTTVNQFPLFRLYDFYGKRLDDSVEYPSSNFAGSRVFGYNESSSSTATTDPVLGIKVTYDVNGQIQFNDYLSQVRYTYVENLETTKITGYYFCNIMGDDYSSDVYTNHWRKSPYNSRQYVVDSFVANGLNKAFELSQIPDETSSSNQPNIIVMVTRNGTANTLKDGVDYLRSGKNIIISDLEKGDNVLVKTFSSGPKGSKGLYEVPSNLASNPTNSAVGLVSMGDVYAQFSQIMSEQEGFSGDVSNINNWHTLENIDLTLGTHIIQNEASMLPLMLTCSDSKIDIVSAIRYCSDEYTQFKSKFETTITGFINNGTYNTISETYDEWVDAALERIAKGMNISSPFFNSTMGVTDNHQTSFFIPPTPSFLGIMPFTTPRIETDSTIPSNPKVIIGHDCSKTLAYGDFRDNVILTLETRIYNSIPDTIKNRASVPLMSDGFIGDQAQGYYSQEEYLSLLQGEFDRFTTQYGLPRYENSTFDIANPFSYNWSSVQSNIDGEKLPGSWRAIYQKYYGTESPHTTPWEMFGFTEKPTWWEGRYGANFDTNTPNDLNFYTRNNKILWDDVKNGYIALGDRQGTYSKYARPNIYRYLPVDEQGYLLDPVQAGIAKNYPVAPAVNDDWQFGDQGSSENIWKRSSAYSFAKTIALYLMKPARFVSTYWDSLDYDVILAGSQSEQKINLLIGQRDQFYELYSHGEYVDNKFVQKYGVEQFISNYLMSQNKDITTYLGKPYRGLDVRLGHKMAGFTNGSDNVIITDTNDVIPTSNISTIMYQSKGTTSASYSGAIVVRGDGYWKVYGFDNINPEFKVILPNESLTHENVSSGTVKSNLVYNWAANTYYQKGVTVRYDNSTYYACVKSHTSGKTFEKDFWTLAKREEYTDNDTVKWYHEGNGEVSSVAYGTKFYSLQDLANFFNGLQRYQESVGFIFETVSDNTIKDYRDSMKQVMKWSHNFASTNSFFAVSPLSSALKFKTEFGEIQNVEQIVNGQYGVVDKTGAPIEKYNLDVSRSDGEISLTPLNDQGIFGVKIYVNTLEHAVLFDNQTVFGDIIYNPIMNVRQPRLKFQGYRTTDWNGRLNAPGFIISDNKVIPNFEKSANDFRKLFEIDTIDNSELQDRARANIGFVERPYMTNLGINSTNQFEFYQGMIQDKGTPLVFKRLMRSDLIRSSKNISYHEEWAFRIGTYGSDNIRPSIVFNISKDEISNDPQIFEFNTKNVKDHGTLEKTIHVSNDISDKIPLNIVYSSIMITKASIKAKDMVGSIVIKSGDIDIIKTFELDKKEISFSFDNPILIASDIEYDVKTKMDGVIQLTFEYQIPASEFVTSNTDNTIISLNDVKSLDTGKYIVKDTKWSQRFNIDNISWPTKYFDQITEGFYPNAGYVNIDTVSQFANNSVEFKALYHDVIGSNSPTNITKSYQFTQKGGSNSETIDLIKSQQNGYFRVNSVVVNINKAPLLDLTVKIGTDSGLNSGNIIEEITPSDFQSNTNSITKYPSKFWKLGENDTIKAQFIVADSSEVPSSITLADIEVIVDVDWITDSILPTQRAWVYSYDTSWKTFSLVDQGCRISSVELGSFDGQGSVVTSKNGVPSDGLLVVDGVQNTNDTVTEILKPKFSNSVSVMVDGSVSKTKIVKNYKDAGMNITNISINVIKPFKSSGDMTFNIGTDNNQTLLSQSAILSNPVPSTPDFSATTNVTTKLANSKVTVANSDQTIQVHVVRYGNIYGIPQKCGDLPITTVDWEYSILDSNGNPTTWSHGGTITFGSPSSLTDIQESYWHGVGELPFKKDEGNIVVRLTNPVNTLLDNGQSLITVESGETSTTFDPTVSGKQLVNASLFNIENDGDTLYAYIGENTSGLAVITVTYEYSNGFELFTTDGNPFEISGDGGVILSWIPTRQSSTNFDSNFSLLPSGTFVEVDDIGGKWAIIQKTDNGYNVVWAQQEKVLSSQLKSASIYNNVTSDLEETLEVYDPYKGFIPSNAAREISYILEYDPSVNNYGPNGPINNISATWGKEQVGLLWWDVSTVRYLDYENIDLEYRWKHWGQLCPKTSVDVYEWVRSPVPPQSWNNYVAESLKNTNSIAAGFAKNPSGKVNNNAPYYVEEQEWSDVKQDTITVYYFWVLSPTTVPQIDSRNISATSVTNIILSPFENNIAYFAALDHNHLIMGNARNFITNDASLKIQWDVGNNEGNFHKQWLIIRDGDDTETVDSTLWSKMTDSLVGYDSTNIVTEVTGTIADDIPATGSFEVELENIHGDISKVPSAGEIRIGEFWFTYSARTNNIFKGLTNHYESLFKGGTGAYLRFSMDTPRQVPDPSLSALEAVGNLSTPMQSWFPQEDGMSSRTARRVFVETMNNAFKEQPYVDSWYNWQTLFESSDSEPSNELYTYSATSFLYRNQLVVNGIIEEGNTVFVSGQPETNGFWTLWQYSPSHPLSDNEGFVLINSQRWRLQEGEFWEFVDWYADGWGTDQNPMYHFSTITERDSANIDITLLRGTLVEVANTDWANPRWERYVYNSNGWTQVAKEKATFKFLDTFYTNTDVFGYGNYDINTIKTRDGSRELKWILDNMAQVVPSDLILNLFFALVRYSISTSRIVDWAFKTSFMYLGGYTEQLNQNPVQFVDQMPNIVDYIEEVKPYHVTIRDYASTYSANPDDSTVHVTDFDFPVYYETSIKTGSKYRLLSPSVGNNAVMANPYNANDILNDSKIVANNFPWADWFNNYSLTSHDRDNWTPKKNPIRSFDMTIKFDRVSCSPATGWDALDIPWDSPTEIWSNGSAYNSSELFKKYRDEGEGDYKEFVFYRLNDMADGSEDGDTAYCHETEETYMWYNGKWNRFKTLLWDIDTEGGEATRIDRFYEPSPTMAPKDMSCLLDGCGFRGTEVKGGNIDQGLWDMFPYDGESGWNNEFGYYDSGMVFTDTTLNNSKLKGRDFDVTSVALNENLPYNGTLVDGGNIVQPEYSANSPEESAKSEILSSLVIYITDDSGQYSIVNGNDNSWLFVKLKDEGIKVVSDNTTSIRVKCDDFVLHDPANPSDEYLAMVKSSYVDMGISKEDQKKILGRLMPGSIMIRTNNSWEYIQYWDVRDNNDGTYTLGALQRNYSGVVSKIRNAYSTNAAKLVQNSVVYDTSIRNWLTRDNQINRVNGDISPKIKFNSGTDNGKNVWKIGDFVACGQ